MTNINLYLHLILIQDRDCKFLDHFDTHCHAVTFFKPVTGSYYVNGTGALGCDVPAAAVHVCPPDQGAGDGARRRVQKVPTV